MRFGLFHPRRPPQLSRPGHRPSHPRRAPAARSDRRQAARALPSAAGLARSAHRARFCLSPIRTQSTHGIATATNITGAAVPESDPTEILSPVGTISPRHARLCRPRWLLRPATLAEKRGFSTVTGEFRRETRLSAGGNRIRTISPAPAKGSSGRCQSETAARLAEPPRPRAPKRRLSAHTRHPTRSEDRRSPSQNARHGVRRGITGTE